MRSDGCQNGVKVRPVGAHQVRNIRFVHGDLVKPLLPVEGRQRVELHDDEPLDGRAGDGTPAEAEGGCVALPEHFEQAVPGEERVHHDAPERGGGEIGVPFQYGQFGELAEGSRRQQEPYNARVPPAHVMEDCQPANKEIGGLPLFKQVEERLDRGGENACSVKMAAGGRPPFTVRSASAMAIGWGPYLAATGAITRSRSSIADGATSRQAPQRMQGASSISYLPFASMIAPVGQISFASASFGSPWALTW